MEPVETNDAVEIEEELWVNGVEVGQDVVGWGKMVCPFGSIVVVYIVLTTISTGTRETVTYLQFRKGSIIVLETK